MTKMSEAEVRQLQADLKSSEFKKARHIASEWLNPLLSAPTPSESKRIHDLLFGPECPIAGLYGQDGDG